MTNADEMNDKMIKTRNNCTKTQLKMSFVAAGVLSESDARTILFSCTPVEEMTPWRTVSLLLCSSLACSRAQPTCSGSLCGLETVEVSG